MIALLTAFIMAHLEASVVWWFAFGAVAVIDLLGGIKVRVLK